LLKYIQRSLILASLRAISEPLTRFFLLPFGGAEQVLPQRMFGGIGILIEEFRMPDASLR
jgi:hypothetical protein